MRLPLKELLADFFDREKLALRLVEYPFLRLLIFSFWFRLVVAGFALFFVFMALFLPKIWRTTPPGFMPVIRVSGLDMVQAWSLERTAQQAMAAGQTDKAIDAWRAAIANNPAKPELSRGLLEAMVKAGGPKAWQGLAVGQSVWLLRLTRTNSASVELAARVYDKYHFNDLVLHMLGPIEDRLSPGLEPVYLKALFNAGRVEAFARRWRQQGASGNAELGLYWAAYQAGWGSPAEAGQGRQRLTAAWNEPGSRDLANRLELKVSRHLGDTAGYQQALERLAEWREDRLPDHVNYWRLLVETGRRAEAVQLARNYPNPPTTADETVQLAEAYAGLGLLDQARQTLEQWAPAFGYAEGVWLSYAGLLIQERQWDALLALALQIRQQKAMRDTLAGYSYYLEGRAQLEQQRQPLAEAAFQKIAEFGFQNESLALQVALNLLRLDYPGYAKDLLDKYRKKLEANPYYWQLAFAAANALKQAEPMLEAARSLYQLEPNDWVAMNNYAASLLTLRQQPDEAIKLTVQLLAKKPDFPGAKINHSLALLQNERAREAEALMDTIDPDQLNPQEKTTLYMARLEACVNLGDYARALQFSGLVDPQFLFPAELKRLESERQQIALHTKEKP